MSARAGTLRLLRTNLRRDRFLLPGWGLFLVLMVAVSSYAMVDLYPGAVERTTAAHLINTSPGLVALYGPIINESSLGELSMSKMTVMYALFVAGLMIVIVRRHTRTEEETGRAELLAATPIDRFAVDRAAVLEAFGASCAVGLLAALANMAAGLPALGSLAFGLSWVGIGLVGTAVAAVACQLSASTRTCGGIAIAVLGVWFVLRAAGDLGSDALGWLSPLGWGTRLDAWGATRWWVLVLYVALTAGLLAFAGLLRRRRDLGSGLVAARPGPTHARLGSAVGLTWRLNRTTTLWWLVAAFAWGVLFGSIAPHMGGLFDSPSGRAALEALGGKGRVEEVMLAALLAIMAALMSAYPIQLVGGAAREETEGRTSALLAAHGSRAAVFAAQGLLALLGAAVLAVAYGVGSAIGYGSQTRGIGAAMGILIPAALAYVPAMWVVASLAVVAWALRASSAWAGWVILLVFVTLGEFGPLLKLPSWIINLSPFQHVVKVPVQPVNPLTEAALVGVALACLGAAWWRYRSRDIG